MPKPLVYLLYNALLPLALLAGFPSFILKGVRRGGLARNFRQRLGRFHADTLERFAGRRPVWIHAVSVGEVFVALKIVEAIHARHPGQAVVLSTTTTTGYAVASERNSAQLTVIHNPVDLPWITARVLRLLDPAALVLVEAEVWPNLVAQAKRRGVPVCLVNARLSPRSAARYRRFRPFVAPIFSQLDLVTVPFEADLARWTAIGVPKERIFVHGSVKFDQATGEQGFQEKVAELRAWLAREGLPEGSRIVLAGSTHDGEEALVARTLAALEPDFPGLALVAVPRHAERGAALAVELRALGFDPVLRSARPTVLDEEEAAAAPTEPTAPGGQGARVWISDTTGELRAWFQLAELVVIGKSFHGGGGQNPVEPVLAHKPVVVGPRMENFADVVSDLLAARGIRQVPGDKALAETLREFLADPEAGLAMAARGSAAMARHEGAAARSATAVLAQMEQASPPPP